MAIWVECLTSLINMLSNARFQPLVQRIGTALEFQCWTFLDDFQKHWPTDAEYTYVDFIRHGSLGEGEARSGSARWRRIAEERAGAKSVFHFDVPGSVAKASNKTTNLQR